MKTGLKTSGGEAGIRTLGTGVSPYNGLANRRIQPLCHLSGWLGVQFTTAMAGSFAARPEAPVDPVLPKKVRLDNLAARGPSRCQGWLLL
jgi:hypothetical protein